MDARGLLTSTLNGLWSNLYHLGNEETEDAEAEHTQGSSGMRLFSNGGVANDSGTNPTDTEQKEERWLEVYKSERGHGRRLTLDCHSLASSLASLACSAGTNNDKATGIGGQGSFESNVEGSGLNSLSEDGKRLTIPKVRLYSRENVVGCWATCTVALSGSARRTGCGRGQLYLTTARLVFIAEREDAKSGCRSWDLSLPAIGAVEIHRKPGDRFVSMLELHAKSYRHYIIGFEFEDVADTKIYDLLCFAPGRPILCSFETPDDISLSKTVPSPVSWGSSLFNADGAQKEHRKFMRS